MNNEEPPHSHQASGASSDVDEVPGVRYSGDAQRPGVGNGRELDQAVRRIQYEMDKRGWSQRMLADKALVGESTIFRLFRGQYTRKTLVKVEHALGLETSTYSSPTYGALTGLMNGASGERQRVDFSHVLNAQAEQHGHEPARSTEVADLSFGGYARKLFEHYQGEYRVVRPAFSSYEQVIAYRFDMVWSNDPAGIAFHDRNPGYEQRGMLLVPSGTPLIHLLTCDAGCARLITAYHLPPGRRTISGVALTIANPTGRQLFPASVPICLVKLGGSEDPMREIMGLMSADDHRLDPIRDLVSEWANPNGHFLRADPTTA
ncbi:MAG: helix-turn-helix transcriptional regulator [Pseudomonadota bacterium]